MYQYRQYWSPTAGTLSMVHLALFINVTDLSLMLKNAVETIRPPGVEIFMSPVDTVMNPNYIDYIFHPMDLGTISQKVC